MIPKSTKILSAIVALLAIWAAIALFQSNKTNTLASEDTQFAVADSGTVTKVLIFTDNKKELSISQSFDAWLINESIKADDEKMNNLLSFVYRAQVKRPVYKEQIEKVVAQLKSNGLKIQYMGEKGLLKSFWLAYLGGAEDEMVALMEGFQLPYVVQVPGFSGSLAQLFRPQPEAWKTRLLFSSKLNNIENIKVKFNFYPENGFEIVKSGNAYKVNEVAKADSVRLYSYLQLYQSVAIREWLDDSKKSLKDSLLAQKPAFEISLTDRNPNKSNAIKIYFNEGQKGNIYGLVGKQEDLCIIKTSIFEYLLQKRSFFEGKK